MDVGVTAAFDFSGTPPFTIEYTEQRRGARAISRKQRFEAMHGEIVLLPEHEGSYTYVS
jgi:nucleoporin POM152